MTEAIKAVIDKDNKRPRKLTGVKSQEIIKSKLTKTKYQEPKLIYQDDDATRLKQVRERLEKNDNYSYCIRKNKIYECRKKQKKIDVIKSTISQTINILKNHKHITTDDTLRLEQVVFNDLLDGSFKTTFKIKEQN